MNCKKCDDKRVFCRRHKSNPAQPPPAVLPEERIRDAKVFEIVGVDLAAPIFLKDGTKAWICLFTCAIYRALHLELVTTLSTEGFLEVLRRFIARRGRPRRIYSDNGTNFRGSDNMLQKVNWSKITDYSAIRKIEWKCNPPSAPWWEGWWECLVRIVKDFLKRVLAKSCLTYEEMNTVLCECESIINSCPISYMSDDPLQPEPLSPAMFLQEITETGTPDLDQIDEVDLKRRVKYRQKVRDDLRRSFRKEYLGQLSRKMKQASDCVVKVGDVVLVGSDNDKRLNWPLACVTSVIAGRDGENRVVKLKTASGELVRPIQRAFPSECSDRGAFKEMHDESELKKKNPVYTRSGRLVKIPERL
ncbi:uncharacterized protein LOC122503064 [Leptopilina heterotoma]|uniref:uncharacterized protein LOC122503064 n=1 Tax=Leptopilina heterotoma TaxID=63436 RepID=UPI001CAA329D|nr:uncharacterized protein LOC122503064 [Leptopilina heterotoma]